MSDYKKIATIIIRISGVTFILSGILDTGILVTGILLMSLELIPKDAFAYEIYSVQAVFFLLGGLILYKRSKSLANSIVDGLRNDETSASE